jgi:hypothetical protein
MHKNENSQASILLEKLLIAQLYKKLTGLYGPYAQEPTTGLCPEPDQSIQYHVSGRY